MTAIVFIMESLVVSVVAAGAKENYMFDFKKVTVLIGASVILNFYLVDSCLGMQSSGPPGGMPMELTALLGDEPDLRTYQKFNDVASEQEFYTLVVAAISGDNASRIDKRRALKDFLDNCRAEKITLESRAQFHKTVPRDFFDETLIGPLRFAAEHNDRELLELLIRYEFEWLEVDGIFDGTGGKMPNLIHKTLIRTFSYNRVTLRVNNYAEERKNHVCTKKRCGLAVVAAAIGAIFWSCTRAK